jgi:hypothetical protein
MNPLQERLASLRRRLRLRIGWTGICSLVGLLVGAALLAGLTDWFIELPSLIRALALVSILGTAGWVAYQALLQPLASRCDDLALALQIEEHYPDLNDSLASTVQFLQEKEGSPQGSSASLRQAAIQRTLALTENYDFNKIIQRRGQRWLACGALLACAVAGYFFFQHQQFAEIALWRLADPFGRHTWTTINLDETPHLVAQGQPFVLRGTIAGIVPPAARIEMDGGLKSEKIFPLKTDARTNAGILVAPLDITQHKGKFRFRIFANDAVYPSQVGQWHEVEVSPPPKFALLDGQLSPKIKLRYPAYTDKPPADSSPGTKHIAEYVGTHVTYRAAFDRPLQEAWIEYRPDAPFLRNVAFLAHLGQANVLNALGALNTSHAVWGRMYATIEDENIITVRFVPSVSGTYILHVRDTVGLAKDFEADLRVLEDPVPTVQLQRPASSSSVVPDAEIAFKMLVGDEIFAVRSVFIEYRRKDVDNRWLDESPQRVVLYDHATMEKVVPRLLAGLGRRSLAGPDLRLRLQKLEIGTKWALQNQFKVGETIVLQVGADDFCDLFPDRPPGRSHEIELRIVSKEEIARNLDDGLAKAQQEIVRLQKLQEEANNLIKDVQKKSADNKVSKKEVDELIEAEQLQKQIQERLGNSPEDGLREELAKLQQSIKDNKLPPSKVQDQIKTLKNELERLAQEDLPQIEPNLAEARKELVGAAPPTPKNKGPLDKAEKLQEQAKKTLDDLAKFLDPWASMHQIQGETRALLDKQKDLRKDVEKILTDKNDNANAELEQKGDMQAQLAKDTDNLIDKMKKAAKNRGKQGDKAAEEKLTKAAQIGEAADLHGVDENKALVENMRDVANEIKQNPLLNKVRDKQSENVKTLEKMLSALEGRKEDDLDRLQKKHKAAAQVKENVDKLAQDQDTLRKKTKEANKIENPEERAKELKKLAEQQEKLKDEAQKNARELARLQEEQAAKALDRAAGEMDKAAQKLEDGQNPDENQQEALDRVEDAQTKLEEFEEELSREQLAQIADRIKGLKERQDAAVERSKDLHKKVVAKMKWSTGLLETLDGDITSQKGLADETRALKEKIKEAKIFEHVFEKAANSMDDAADGMTERKETGKDRRLMDLEQEELADENNKAKGIEKLQTLASKRLQRLLDSLKNDPADQAQNDDPNKQPDDKGGEQQEGQKMKPGDGVPPLAQLKVLRAEQLEVNEQTNELIKIHPKLKDLNEEQRRQYLTGLNEEQRNALIRELTSLETEQKRLHELFEQMIAAEKKGGEQ